MRWLIALVLTAGLAHADGEAAGEFDYYVLSLSWSPNWCKIEGDARNSPQCDPDRDFGWILHGLWPQYENGWPSNCFVLRRDPSRSETEAMADIMGTSGLAWYQWKKHGRCSGLSATDYFALARQAYTSVARPEVFRKLNETVQLPAHVVEEAFIEANPALGPDMITITCKGNWIQEARICLTKDLQPRDCGVDVVRDCSMEDALFDPVR